VFPDSKTLVDCTPKENLALILEMYDKEKAAGKVDVAEFVHLHFDLPQRPQTNFKSEELAPIQDHLQRLWPVLTRNPDAPVEGSSLRPLPNAYVVPGGRFSEVYYWDSYFTQLGLNVHGRADLIRSMVDNFAYLIDTIGHIPNGNRKYYESRSQPPFFSLMVRLLQEHDSTSLVKYLPSLEKEYEFWMTGADQIQNPGEAINRVVIMSDGTVMNRYWDNLSTPRPEAYKEDVKLREETGRDSSIFRELRAAAESGWDFSTRWLADGKTLGTIHTTDIVPVDLNSLMFHLEQTIAEAYERSGDPEKQSLYKKKAAARRRCLLTFMWDVNLNYFVDYDFVKNQSTGIKSLAGMFPLFFKIIQQDLAEKSALTISKEFLKQGGVLTTLTASGQQWDAPNGWAPLQWITYKGLKNYHLDPLANSLRDRWLAVNERVYKRTGKMLEKYNVVDTTLIGGGGEYPNQDGFGWTNGVYLALDKEKLNESKDF
jgi:alpha,alpha-trehalase